MVVLIKSAPDTTDGNIGLNIAKQGSADVVLLQNGVYFGQRGKLGDFRGAVFMLDDDKRLRGLKDSEIDAKIKTISYDSLTEIVTSGKKVVGMF